MKPNNLLIGPDNKKIWLSDFGIAIVAHSTKSMEPQDGRGTSAYMSPEQALNRAVIASDQYSLAVVVYEWLTGYVPFLGSDAQICMQHIHEPIPSLRQKAPEVPVEVEEIVMRALSKDPKERFPSVAEFAKTLRSVSVKIPTFTKAFPIFAYGYKERIGKLSVRWSLDEAEKWMPQSRQNVAFAEWGIGNIENLFSQFDDEEAGKAITILGFGLKDDFEFCLRVEVSKNEQKDFVAPPFLKVRGKSRYAYRIIDKTIEVKDPSSGKVLSVQPEEWSAWLISESPNGDMFVVISRHLVTLYAIE